MLGDKVLQNRRQLYKRQSILPTEQYQARHLPREDSEYDEVFRIREYHKSWWRRIISLCVCRWPRVVWAALGQGWIMSSNGSVLHQESLLFVQHLDIEIVVILINNPLSDAAEVDCLSVDHIPAIEELF